MFTKNPASLLDGQQLVSCTLQDKVDGSAKFAADVMEACSRRGISFNLLTMKALYGCGVYMYLRAGRASYIGAARNMFLRATGRNHHKKEEIAGCDELMFLPTESFDNALQLEKMLINALLPDVNERNGRIGKDLEKLSNALGITKSRARIYVPRVGKRQSSQ